MMPTTCPYCRTVSQNPFEVALVELVNRHLVTPSTIVFHDADGEPVRASAILRSIDTDGVLADRFVQAVTRMSVILLAKATRTVSEDTVRQMMREEMTGFDWEDVFEVAVAERMKRLAVEHAATKGKEP